MSVSTEVLIALTEAKARLEGHESEPVEDRLRIAMKATFRHWMATEDDDQFKAAVGAVLVTSDDDTKQRIEDELRALRSLNALLSGVPVDMDRFEAPTNTIGLLRLWNEVKGS